MNFGGTIRLNRTGWMILVVMAILMAFIHFNRPKYSKEEGIQENMVDLKSLLIGAIEASQLGGKKVISGSRGELNIESKGKTLEGVNDPVTSADLASHCEMYNSLQNAFPQIHIRSEEEHSKGDKCPKGSVLKLKPLSEFTSIEGLANEYVQADDVTVWIDPLDATKEYTERLYEFVTTMVCVAVKGNPIIGVIHKPFTKQTSWGWLTKLNSPDLQKQNDPAPDARENPTIIVSRSHQGKVEEVAKTAFGSKSEITSAAGAGYKILEIAHGKADVYLHSTEIKKWDICAGNAIVNALGGRMTTLQNVTLDYSYDSESVNKDGLLVAIHDHSFYSTKISKNIK